MSSLPRVLRFSAAHRVRAIGPTTLSLGAPSAPSQPHTLGVLGLVNDATFLPEASVKFRTSPVVRPENFTFGWSVNGTTVSVFDRYAFHASVMYGSRYVGLVSPA